VRRRDGVERVHHVGDGGVTHGAGQYVTSALVGAPASAARPPRKASSITKQ
jgi:hypothetical protein